MALGSIVLVLIIMLCLFFRLYRPFGGHVNRRIYRHSANYSRGAFVNAIPTPMHIRFSDMWSILWAYLQRNPQRKPGRPLQPARPLITASSDSTSEPRITWFGHSTFLLQCNGTNVLLDPMFGRAASPFPAIGPQRFSGALPLAVGDLPPIDAVLISHDHYDHLDYGSIRQLRHKVGHFFVPLGLGAHLQRWGVSPQAITELDWWHEATFGNMQFVCTPARHFSGRTLTDRFATLWCSWVIKTGSTSIFFSGDTGYGPHFKQIGAAYGPFDLTLLECGQYDKRWPTVHMFPEQTVKAHQELRGKHLLPIHWGAFVLALHDWTDPVERLLQAAQQSDTPIITPPIGHTIILNGKDYPREAWWKATE